jgi:hypothetical protein
MSYDKNAFKATGTSPHEDFDFKAVTGDKTTWAPTWGFVTSNQSPLVMFKIGGSFGGFHYGAQGYGGYPDDSGNIGPQVNSYSDFAGVFGTGVYVTGVAGTSVNNVGVYGQTGQISTTEGPQFPQNIVAGVFGAAPAVSGTLGWGVAGWAPYNTAVQGFSYANDGVGGLSHQGTGVMGISDLGAGVFGHSGIATLSPGQNCGVIGFSGFSGPTVPNPVTVGGVWGSSNASHGVIGTSNEQVGVFGYSSRSHGVFGFTSNRTGAFAGIFDGNVYSNGTISATVKNAIVPFPDGSRRLLHCMESPEHWFEDFGSAKLARGRAVVKLDANFAKVIKRGDYRVFVTPEGDCRGLYVRHKSANRFEVRELTGGKSSVAFSYRIVGRRKDIKRHQRFAKFDTRLPLPAAPARAPRKPTPTAAGLRAFVARVEKEARERAPKGAEKGRARMRTKRSRPPMPPRQPLLAAKK